MSSFLKCVSWLMTLRARFNSLSFLSLIQIDQFPNINLRYHSINNLKWTFLLNETILKKIKPFFYIRWRPVCVLYLSRLQVWAAPMNTFFCNSKNISTLSDYHREDSKYQSQNKNMFAKQYYQTVSQQFAITCLALGCTHWTRLLGKLLNTRSSSRRWSVDLKK